MTIDEAIAHALEVAGEQQERADSAGLIDILDGLDVESCKECAADHRQLAEWLMELKEAKRLLKAAVVDIHSRDYCHGCIYENAEGKEQYLNCEYHNCFKWRYADEALKLIES